MDEQQTPASKPKHMFFFNLRVGTYTTIAFVTFLSRVVPGTQLFSTICLAGYGLYMFTDIHKGAIQDERHIGDYKKAFRWSATRNSLDIALYFLAVIVGSFI
jgi:hypothetical protein